MDNNKENYEMVNHPSHYNKYDIEVIDMMEKIWGPAATALWCKMTAYKYRMRLGEKPDNPIEQDLAKEDWYLKTSEKYKNINPKQYENLLSCIQSNRNFY